MSRMSLAVEKQAARPTGDAETAIARLAAADRALAEAIEVASAVDLVATAKALSEWASAVKAGEEHRRAAAVFVLRAMRNAGERIRAAQERGEVATPGLPPSQRDVAAADIPPATLAEIGVTRDESSEWKRLAAVYPTDAELEAAAETMERPSLARALFTSESAEWYTPREIIVGAIAALGTIDLDPCAEPAKGIPARTHYTVQDDGLAQGWRGTVYMNPPYGREIGAWCDKLAAEYAYGNVSAAVALLPARTDTAWWRALPAEVVCFVAGRLRFSNADAAPFPSVVAYLGPDPALFVAGFSPLGLIYTRMEAAA